MPTSGNYFHLHLVSDSTGETLITVARAVAAQYANVTAVEHVYPLVRSQKQLDHVLDEIEEAPGTPLLPPPACNDLSPARANGDFQKNCVRHPRFNAIVDRLSLQPGCWSEIKLAHDRLEREIKFFNQLEGAVCTMCA